VLLPWYPVWALPLAWLAPKAARTAIVATASIMGVTLWSAEALRFPGAFDLNLFIGRFIVTPVLLGLLAWVIADLRDRIRDGGSFGDEQDERSGLAPAPAPIAHEPPRPERVPQPAG
jgi:hypothetical protein